ncbi:MAG: hypothetical protein L0346_23140 [Chloroflexi bacterium]|nr:hypothetical protein [Chloroflexota bacterium]
MRIADDRIPARRVLEEATAANQRLGHENLGFLSESHGFMPCALPLLELPGSHRAWDETAAALPELFRTLRLRPVLDRIPVLDASAAALPDLFALRASAILSIFAHAYFYVEAVPPGRFPDSILLPWATISQRLQRPAPHLSFIDLNVYNWQFIDPAAPDPMRMENLRLLIPILGNEDERRFQAVPIEILARFTPLLGAVVRAQEAAARDDPAALKQELLAITAGLERLTYDSFMKVNPNAHSPLYVNPVVWGKTVAPLATPYQADGSVPGPSGTAIPAFQLLDIFFGRQGYNSSIGHETARARSWFPPHWIAFLNAAEAVDVPAYVGRVGDPELDGLFRQALDAYAADTGLLGRHRLKTYGFLDLSFKAGRSKTLGGFAGQFDDRLWDRMDGELDTARRERYGLRPQAVAYARVKRVEELANSETDTVRRVVLDVAGRGLRYHPGDRCAILPENSPELVERTLRALRAQGDEPVALTTAWRGHANLREGYEGAQVLSLRTLLAFGRIRPVSRLVARALYSLSHNPLLGEIIEARAEDQWELWDLLEMLATCGFNPKQLWKAPAGEQESIGRIVPPESFRMYSISSVMDDPAAMAAGELSLTVGRLRYQTAASPVTAGAPRHGTASDFLARLADDGLGRPGSANGPRSVTIRLVHPPRFSLPADPTRPVVMLAGGTGLGPFRSLLQARLAQPNGGPNWLFFSTRTPAELLYQEEWREAAAGGRLHMRVTFSRADQRARLDPGGDFVFTPAPRGRLDRELLAPETAALLWELLQSRAEGGQGATFYVCGRTGFANTVMAAIKQILAQHAPGPEAERPAQAQRALYRLVGEERYLQEIFTTYSGPQSAQRRLIDASEVVTRNNEAEGFWMILNGRVYDLSEFAHLHPGGLKIIQSYAGMDATHAYRTALHDINPEVDAMLGMFKLGAVRRLRFGQAWGVAVGENGLQVVTLKELYRAWISYLYTAVEMENAMTNDFGVRGEPVTYDERPEAIRPSPYKVQALLQSHERFWHSYLAKLAGPALHHLWALTSGLCSTRRPATWMAGRLARLARSRDGRRAAALGPQLVEQLHRLAQAETPWDDPAVQAVAARVDFLETADRALLADLKQTLRRGLQLFEQYESATLTHGRAELLATIQAIPDLIEAYYGRLASSSQ